MSTTGTISYDSSRDSRTQVARDESRRRAEANRAGRSVDNATRKSSRSKRGKVRMPKAPNSASQYHYHLKFSNRAGANNAPQSAVGKIKYDFVMDVKETESSRLGYTYVSAPPNTPVSALDPLAMATVCDQSLHKKAKLITRIMAHADLSLPKELSQNQRHELICKIADHFRDELQVPIYVAEHAPDEGNHNWHIHITHPLRHVHATNDGGFRLGDKIIQYQRPEVRRAAGLPAKTNDDLRKMRAAIGNLIGASLVKANVDADLAERWRHGYLRLHQQVEKAIERGDVEFVSDNALRAPTKKEGYNTSRWNKPSYSERREYAEEHNHTVQDDAIAVETVVRNAFDRILKLAEKANLKEPEHIRMLARDHGIKIEWTRASKKRTAKVTGMRVNNLTGKETGTTLYDLKKRMGWKEPPAYKQRPDKDGEDFNRYAELVRKANIGVIPGQPKDIIPKAMKVTQIIAERQLARAATVRDATTAQTRQDATNATKERGVAASAQRSLPGEKPQKLASDERPDTQDQRQNVKNARDGSIFDQPSHTLTPIVKPASRPSKQVHEQSHEEISIMKSIQPLLDLVDEIEEGRLLREKKRIEEARREDQARQTRMSQYGRMPIPAGNIRDSIQTPEDSLNKQKDKIQPGDIGNAENLQEQLDKLNASVLHDHDAGMLSHRRYTNDARPRPRG